MPLFGKKAKGKTTKLFFVTDVHGSQSTFRKFVNAGKFYEVDVLVLGGDIAGKMVVPILDLGGSKYRATIQSITQELDGADEVAEFEKRAAKLGSYTAVVTSDEYQVLAADPAGVDALYHRLATERMRQWIEFAEERLAGSGIRCYITGGNDDSPDILQPLVEHDGPSVIACEEKQVVIDDEQHLMLSSGLSNPTPWDTPREVPDDELARHIEGIVAGVDDFSRVDLQLPRAAQGQHARHGGGARLDHRPSQSHHLGRHARHVRRGQRRGTCGHREVPALAEPARPHPRVAGSDRARPHGGGQPGE